MRPSSWESQARTETGQRARWSNRNKLLRPAAPLPRSDRDLLTPFAGLNRLGCT